MLVGSCLPSVKSVPAVVIWCAHPACWHVVTATTEDAAMAALDAHYRWSYARQGGPHASE